jgi:serine protease Do
MALNFRPSLASLLLILLICTGIAAPDRSVFAAMARAQVAGDQTEAVPAEDIESDELLDSEDLDDDLPLDIPLDRANPSENGNSNPESAPLESPDDSDSAATSTPDPDADITPDTELDADEVDLESESEVSIDFLFDGESPTSIDQLKAMEMHFASLADQVSPATVNIQIGMAQGSGVVVSEDGYILTAAHVIGRPGNIASVTFPDGSKVKANTLGLARKLDFGMLKILEEEGNDFPHLDVGLSAELQPGQWVMAVGHPGGIDEKRGLVFRAGRIISNQSDRLQTDCTLVGGDSGGPLVDMNGEVIGIHSRIGSRLWDNLHAPIDIYSQNWDRMDRGLVLDGAPYLGFTVKPNSNRVSAVTEKGPADKAGIKPQDRIVAIDGNPIKTYKQLEVAIARLLPYQKIKLKIKRRSKTLTLEVIVSENN